jgi:hypothetical protein
MAVKLFVGGLSFSTSNERLREAFAAAGSVESASVVTDRDTGRSRGFGFVEMATPEEAEQARTSTAGLFRSRRRRPQGQAGEATGAAAVAAVAVASAAAVVAAVAAVRAAVAGSPALTH